jgi:hypothetical protein
MVKKKNQKDILPIDEIPQTPSAFIDPGNSVVDIFKTLSTDEQDTILHYIIDEDGFSRLMGILRSKDTPGAADLFLDRVRYIIFFHYIKINKSGRIMTYA